MSIDTLLLTIKPRRGSRIKLGHPWVFRDEIVNLPSPIPNGAEADVVDLKGKYIGRGLLSAESQIVCRLYSRLRESLDREFFRRRILAAHEYRRSIGLPNDQTDSFREVFAEGDLLPGLTVDRYGDYLAIQTPTAAMDQRQPMLLEILDEVFRPRGICERNEMAVREQDGLTKRHGWVAGTAAERIIIRENGLSFEIDPLGAMKTGHFFDQRDNRGLLQGRCRGRAVMEMFGFTGGFGLMAARDGAASVLSVDSSETAIQMAQANAQRNQLSNLQYQIGDAFETLRALETEGRRFDFIVLDPPAFAKKRTHLENAVRGYKQINLRALKMLPQGGHLLTCSCSFHLDPVLFAEIVTEAAADAGCLVRVLAARGAAPDHPVLLNVPETDYLKCLFVEVIEKYGETVTAGAPMEPGAA